MCSLESSIFIFRHYGFRHSYFHERFALIRRTRLKLAATEVETAAATAATVTTCGDAANQKDSFAPARRQHEIGINVLFAKLFANVET